MNSTLQQSDTVGTWVMNYPSTSRVFERHRIDYCCRGNRSLQEACSAAQTDARLVLAELHAAISQNSDEPETDFVSMSLAEMCDSIEATHHAYLRDELPRLTQLVEKVHRVHGEQHAWLNRVAESFQKLCAELMPHMMKEERILFPAIRAIEQTRCVPEFPFGSVDNPIHMMEHEHAIAGQALQDIRTASSDYTLPADGCNTFRAMLDGLRELELDLHRHIHKENNVLFPRASRLAAQRIQNSAHEGSRS